MSMRFSGTTASETNADEHNLPRSIHFWSGRSGDDRGLVLTEFWLEHDSDGPEGPFTAAYTVVNEAGELLIFWNWHLAIDPDPGDLIRGYLTDALALGDGDILDYQASGNFDSHDRFNLWDGAEVWPDYRWLDSLLIAHSAHWHTGPWEWNGIDFEL